MKKIISHILVLSLLFALNCGKHEEPKKNVSGSEAELSTRSADAIDQLKNSPVSEPEKEKAASEDSDSFSNQLGKVFTPVAVSAERLLEYNVQLSYECNDLIKTRKELLDFIAKYGYLENSSAMNTASPFMSAKIHVRSSKLYDALLELDKLGTLLSEEISTIDHTEGMVWQKRKMTREKIRLNRRNNANNQIGAGSKNWEAIEESVSNSEDQLDLSEQETWKIRDRVAWATISVGFGIPTPPDKVQIPNYKNAFVGIFNTFLQLTYYLLWWLPFLILGGALVYYTNRIFLKFKKKS
ncbi:DUF4349 domain-containing protein [Leptospira alstonii]|uniref:PF14257 domain protein n=2 Tax=Leptospira alstonii TaxID=28452 RepID=M6CUR4_9LEPT|nr:DUF4349 domain-containing protein [Leptospira alstonii]EMJ95687.1 PF14257 domain protein [Leptospira alstonii serovar Sichuan str. 79601]EQA79154.1 PF14257 domain protein [Leptospira alstonii serovar Pingchang str. 80-412]